MTDSVNLTDQEAGCVALRLAARRLKGEWLEWEDYPNLGGVAFARLQSAMDDVITDLVAVARLEEVAHKIDSAALIESAQA